MAGEVRIEMNSAGVQQLLKSQEVKDALLERATRIAEAANANAGGDGSDFEVDERVGAQRARASIRTASHNGRLAEAEDRALTRALDAGR